MQKTKKNLFKWLERRESAARRCGNCDSERRMRVAKLPPHPSIQKLTIFHPNNELCGNSVEVV